MHAWSGMQRGSPIVLAPPFYSAGTAIAVVPRGDRAGIVRSGRARLSAPKGAIASTMSYECGTLTKRIPRSTSIVSHGMAVDLPWICSGPALPIPERLVGIRGSARQFGQRARLILTLPIKGRR